MYQFYTQLQSLHLPVVPSILLLLRYKEFETFNYISPFLKLITFLAWYTGVFYSCLTTSDNCEKQTRKARIIVLHRNSGLVAGEGHEHERNSSFFPVSLWVYSLLISFEARNKGAHWNFSEMPFVLW